jgi:hypothetical protein
MNNAPEMQVCLIFLVYFSFLASTDFSTHTEYFFDKEYRDIIYKCPKIFYKQKNGRRRALVPVLDPTRPVWNCPERWPSRFRLIFTRLNRIHDGRTRITDGAQP